VPKEVPAHIGCLTAAGICEIICLRWLGTFGNFTTACLYIYTCRVHLCLSLDEESAFELNLLTAPSPGFCLDPRPLCEHMNRASFRLN